MALVSAPTRCGQARTLARMRQLLRVAKPRSAGAADAVDHPVVGFLIGGQASSLVRLASSPPTPW